MKRIEWPEPFRWYHGTILALFFVTCLLGGLCVRIWFIRAVVG